MHAGVRASMDPSSASHPAPLSSHHDTRCAGCKVPALQCGRFACASSRSHSVAVLKSAARAVAGADAVIVTGPSAFTATQRAIGALQYMPLLEMMTPSPSLGDPAGCMAGNFTTTPLKTLLLRQVRCARRTCCYVPFPTLFTWGGKQRRSSPSVPGAGGISSVVAMPWAGASPGCPRGQWRPEWSVQIPGMDSQQCVPRYPTRACSYEAAALSNSIVKSRANNTDFAILIGIADSSTYEKAAYPSWLAPPAYQQKCYFADMQHPAADVAAQAAAGLAMAAKVLATHGEPADVENARWYGIEAARAYEYAKLMWRAYREDSICSRSVARTNCVGSGCTKVQEDGKPVQSVRPPHPLTRPPRSHPCARSSEVSIMVEKPKHACGTGQLSTRRALRAQRCHLLTLEVTAWPS